MRKFWKSRPSLKIMTIVVALCMLFIFASNGTDIETGEVLVGLALAALIIAVLWMRNFDPEAFEAHTNPGQYYARQDAQELIAALKVVVNALDHPDYDVRIAAKDQGQQLLDKMMSKAV